MKTWLPSWVQSLDLSFDQKGFWRHSREFETQDMVVDLKGLTVLVTGATSGIGLAVIKDMQNKGAKVLAVGRDTAKGKKDFGVEPMGTIPVQWFATDLSDKNALRDLINTLQKETIDVFVCNAGLMPESLSLNQDGDEMGFTVQVFAHFALIRHLIQSKRLAKGAKVILVSSGGMYLKKLDLQDIHWQRRRYDKLAAYANAKRAQVCLNEMLAEMWHREDLVFSCMHPGWVGTPGVTNSLPTFERWLSGSLRTPEQGADTIIWLATCKSPYVSGRFWFDRHVRSTYAIPRTREGVGEREKLWQMCWQWSDDV